MLKRLNIWTLMRVIMLSKSLVESITPLCSSSQAASTALAVMTKVKSELVMSMAITEERKLKKRS